MIKNKIVVVEDEAELRNTLVDILTLHKFHVEAAANGQEGLNLIRRVMPDLVVSDVMMPVKDGFDLVRELKMDENTELIPVIFLTASVTPATKLSGLEFGADDYITKPFLMDELILKCKNLISTREKLLQKMYTTPEQIVTETEGTRFLKKLKKVVETELGNPDLSMADIAEALHMSTSGLQKKIKSTTNKSVSQFVREYRLKRSRDLIIMNYGNLSEIAEKTGFRSLSYFTTSFKSYFGESPSHVG